MNWIGVFDSDCSISMSIENEDMHFVFSTHKLNKTMGHMGFICLDLVH